MAVMYDPATGKKRWPTAPGPGDFFWFDDQSTEVDDGSAIILLARAPFNSYSCHTYAAVVCSV